jgi:hypothetical protein
VVTQRWERTSDFGSEEGLAGRMGAGIAPHDAPGALDHVGQLKDPLGTGSP